MSLELSKILEFIRSSKIPVTKREVARAFGIKGGENRVALKQILKKLEKDGLITKQPGGSFTAPQGLPAVGVIEITKIEIDGDVLARPVDWNAELQGEMPRIEVAPDNKHFPKVSEGMRMLARFERSEDGQGYDAHIIRVIDSTMGRVLGVLRLTKGGAIVLPTEKRAKFDYEVALTDRNGAEDGDLVIAEILPAKGAKRQKVRVISVLGRQGDPRAISLISLHEAGLREEFPDRVVAETDKMTVPDLKGREDLRNFPLVTIDGPDARDFDDAVFAEKLEDGSYHLIVAIADVAHYVRPGTALDTEAQRRGNSTYFPDRVVPMLPEALSNDLCSLRPNEPRATMAVHLWIDKQGALQKYKFVRGLMRSVARLTYEQVQTAKDGSPDDLTGPLVEPVIKPLYEVFKILDKAREGRGALELDLPERQILLNDKGDMIGVKPRARLDSHKLIEEFMILANVAAASALEGKKTFPCVYRVHDRPSYEKLESAREFVESFGLSLPKGQVVQPMQLNQVLKNAAKLPYSHLISQVILRSQSQANYSTNNIGHFGLALQKYAHFTSPIRRYSDLLVHRALIGAFGLGPGEMMEEEKARLDEICQHISATERTSMEAERNAIDRFTGAYLSERIGAEFAGKISGVTRFGLFVALDETGADGLVPARSLRDDFYIHDERAHALVGRRHGRVYRLGAPVVVRIVEASGITGSSLFELAGPPVGADLPGLKKPNPPKGRHDREGQDRREGGPKRRGKGGRKGGGPKGKGQKWRKERD
ncbi:MAG: ribonuclease R [Alphaproteobacteria bacterium]|nr:ribonuclease R [Alphaproteobacteria bacterium]QQS58231.1 MAG: ribonuclease R [Alphaproteobacteria bacterium]